MNIYLFHRSVFEGDVDEAGEGSSEARQGGYLIAVEIEGSEFFVKRSEVLDHDVHRNQLKKRRNYTFWRYCLSTSGYEIIATLTEARGFVGFSAQKSQ